VNKFGSEGKCAYCFQKFSADKVPKHLLSCSERTKVLSSSGKEQNTFLLEVRGKRFPEYWMFLEVNRDTCMLNDIDTCLRELWLECCGHLSSFTINNQRYESHPDEEYNFKDKSMQVRVNRILEEGMIFEYIYDFGSSTELLIRVVSVDHFNQLEEGERGNKLNHLDARASNLIQVTGKKVKEKGKSRQLHSSFAPSYPSHLVIIAARNDPIIFICNSCKKAVATNICTICLYEKSRKGASLCNNCVKYHKCGEDMFLPVVNSPRSGECGYTGEND
jgi:hypothetical protein